MTALFQVKKTELEEKIKKRPKKGKAGGAALASEKRIWVCDTRWSVKKTSGGQSAQYCSRAPSAGCSEA